MTTGEREEIKVIRIAYLDKYDGTPPFEGSHGFMANITFLEGELARVRLLLKQIAAETVTWARARSLAMEAMKIRTHD